MTTTSTRPARSDTTVRVRRLEQTAAGRPVRSSLARAPFVIALIAVLAFGVGGVLYLNAKTDEAGIRTENARSASRQMRLQIEELNRSVAELSATPRLAEAARQMGLVPVGDAAMMLIGVDGTVTIEGDPRPPDDAGPVDGEGNAP